MAFDEVIATNPPRLVVKFRRGPDGSEQFEWGVVGQIPLLSAIGHLGRVIADLQQGAWMPDCGEHRGALVIVWLEQERELACYCDPDVPATAMAGMLEVIKATLVMSRMGQQVASKKVQLYMPDGSPAG